MTRLQAAMVGAGLLWACSGTPAAPADAGPVDAGPADAGPRDAGCDPGRPMPYEGNGHLDPDAGYDYQSQPPSSGPHDNFLATWGIHATPAGRRHWVHNEEHGGVVLVYNCPDDGGCPDVVAGLTALYNATPLGPFNEVKVVVTPDPDYDGGTVAAAAWGYVYTPDHLDPAAVRCFIDAHIERGPEAAP